MSHREPGVNVRFYKEDVIHGLMSKEAGREVTIQKDFIEIRVAGNDKEVFVGPANEQMRGRFPEEWDAYQRGAGPEHIGTAVRRWPQLTQAQVRTLENHNIYTVEDMASVSDAGLQSLGMGARKLREDAQKFLSLSKLAADVALVDELRDENKALKEQMQNMSAQVAELLQAVKKPEPEEVEQPKRRKAA
jgi:hypothetical protein